MSEGNCMERLRIRIRKGKDEQKIDENADPGNLSETGQFIVEKVEETFREHYPLLVPYSYAAIVEDAKSGELRFLVLEPTLTPTDELWINQIKSILWDELTLSSKEFENKEEAEEFLKKKVEETAKKYKIKVDPYTLGKYQYYITRDFLNFGKIDGFMRDENIEDISCNGEGQSIYVWHRKYESIPHLRQTHLHSSTPSRRHIARWKPSPAHLLRRGYTERQHLHNKKIQEKPTYNHRPYHLQSVNP